MARRIPHECWLLATIAVLVFSIHWLNAADGVRYRSDFLSNDNLTQIARQSALLGLFALGTGIIVIAGGIDLSTGSVICFCGVVCAKLPDWISSLANTGLQAGWIPGFAGSWLNELGLLSADEPYSLTMLFAMVGLTLLVGVLVGLLHALLVNSLELPPFVATLGTMAALRSVASVITTGALGVRDERFRSIGKVWYMPVIFFLIECLLLGILMSCTRLGRHLRALGGNEQAARLSGLNVFGLKRFAYILGAVTASFTGIVYYAFLGNATSQTGVGYELDAIAAAVVGGCNLRGGTGSIFGIVLGVVLLQIVINGTVFVISSQATEWRGLIVGCVVILAVLFGRLGQR